MTELSILRVLVGLLICLVIVGAGAYIMVWVIWAYGKADDWADQVEEYVARHRAKRRRR